MISKKVGAGLAALLVLAVTGCGKSAPAPGSSPAVAPAANTPAATGTGATTTPGGSSAPAATQPGTTAAAPAAAAPQAEKYEKVKLGPLKKGDMAKVGPLEVTLKEIAAIKQTAGLPPGGYAYVLLNITVNNTGSAPYTINNSEHFKMTSPDGKPRSLNMQAMGQRSPTLNGTLEKGQNKAGWLGYMPKLQAGGKFVYVFTHPEYGEATWEFEVN